MNKPRRKEGQIILICSLSSIVLWFMMTISNASQEVTFYNNFVHFMNVYLGLFCETIFEGIYIEATDTYLASAEECSLEFSIKTKTLVLISFAFFVYGLLVFFEHIPSFTDIWKKIKEIVNG